MSAMYTPHSRRGRSHRRSRAQCRAAVAQAAIAAVPPWHLHHTLGQKTRPQTPSLSLPWEVKLMMASNAELHSYICLLQLDLSPGTALTMLAAVARSCVEARRPPNVIFWRVNVLGVPPMAYASPYQNTIGGRHPNIWAGPPAPNFHSYGGWCPVSYGILVGGRLLP